MAVNDIIHHTLTQVFFYFPAYRVVYAEIGQNGIMQAIDSHQPEFMPDITGLTVDLTKNCAYYKALTGGEMIIVSDVREDPLFKNLTEKMESNHVRAALDIPLHVSNGLTGLICLDSSEPRQWSDFEIETLKEVARYLTVAIQEARSMEEREKAEKKYRAVFNSNIVGIGISEKKSGKILDINETGARIFESTPEDLIGKKKSDYFLEPSVREELLAQIDLYAKVQDFQLQIKTEKNKFRWISLNSMLVQLDHQDYIVFLLTDITQKKLIQEELENHRKNLESLVKERTQTLEATLKREKGLSEELKKFLEKEQKLRLEMERTMEKERELMELKSRFISMASHEFRTPLTTILSASDILKRYGEKMTSEEKQVRIRKIQDQVGHMTDMLEDVLLIGQIESGKYNFHPQRADLKILVKQLTEDFKLTTGENHDIHTHFPEKEMPACVDKRLLQNIVTNLLTNAVKYSEPGSRIDVNLFEEDGEIRFQVQDRGIGISEEARQKLFDPFFRAENVGNISGTGLGLSILKNAVDMHRGSIHVDSKPGQGAAFTVSFKKDGGKHE
jgi:PAS domain S-box-containing protein